MEEIANVAITYFESLFNASACDQIDDCLSVVQHKMTPDMQQLLSNDFTADEIKAALFQMGPTKALRPNHMNALFYQNFCHVMGDNVVLLYWII